MSSSKAIGTPTLTFAIAALLAGAALFACTSELGATDGDGQDAGLGDGAGALDDGGIASDDGSGGGDGAARKPAPDPPAGAGFTCAVQTLLATKCQVCHTDPPQGGAKVPLLTVAQLLDWSTVDPSRSVAQVALERMKSGIMPPAFFNNPVTQAEVQAFESWAQGNYVGSCAGSTPISATCTTCHGDSTRVGITGSDANVKSAPPRGAHGETATTDRAVGAHIAHIAKTDFTSAPLACNACHVVPTSMAHSNGSVDMAFGAMATTGGASPTWNGTTCAGNYCHGSFSGGANAAPTWTGGAMACNSCHGAPPATAPHAANPAAECSTCHGAGYSATAKTVNKPTHIDGVVTINGSTATCSTCHGDAARVAIAGADPQVKSAPPLGTKGETATTTRAVGAHMAHLDKGSLSAPLACSECHVVPITTAHSDGVVQTTFGALAKTGGVTPTWNGTTCSSSYCHGNFNGGNTSAAPAWTGPAMACDSCHGLPPSTPAHSNASLDCALCHGAGYSATAKTVNKVIHVNGVINVDQTALSCTSCHGDGKRVGITGADTRQSAAPPVGTHGETATTTRAVGAHTAHLNQATYRATPLSCSECHSVPTSNVHSDGVAQVTFGTLATSRGAAPVWNGATCASVYCHGAFPGGATLFTPSWTGGTITCGSCHSTPPSSGLHLDHHKGLPCSDCHATGYDATAKTVNKTTHINGSVQVQGTKINSYNASTKSCSPTCHGTERW